MGIGCPPNPLKAGVWYAKAASQGDGRANGRLAAIGAAVEREGGNDAAGKKMVDTEEARKKEERGRKWALF